MTHSHSSLGMDALGVPGLEVTRCMGLDLITARSQFPQLHVHAAVKLW